MDTKVCSKCKKEKPINEFHRNNHNRDGYKGTCKDCCRQYNVDHKEEQNEWLRKNRYRYRDKRNKYLREYRKTSKVFKKRMDEKRDKNNAYQRAYRSTPEYKKKARESYQKNKHKYKDKRTATQKKYRKLPEVRIKVALRARLITLLKRSNGSKSDKTVEIIGCTMPFLRDYLANLFTEGMSWGNYGMNKNNWSIDHIVPCVMFDLTDPDQQKQCFNYTNLQPMWVTENLAKNSSFEGVLIRRKAS